MPSWKDGESSCDSLLSNFVGEGDWSPVPRARVPASTFYPDWHGPDDSGMKCKHDLPMHRFVAFEGIDTGRKFLGCGLQEDEQCDKVHWVDGEWPHTLQFSLLQLWKKYQDENATRMSGNVEYAEKNYQLVLEKRSLETINIGLHRQLGQMGATQKWEQVAKVTTSQFELEKAHRAKAEAEVSILKEDKKKLEYYIAELMKHGETNKNKLKKIYEICGE